MTPWLDTEQRAALRTWALVLAGPSLLAVVAWLAYAIAYEFGREALLARINWLGTIAETLAALIAIILCTYAAATSIKSLNFKRGADGSVEGGFASNDDAGDKLKVAGAAIADAGAAIKGDAVQDPAA